MRLLSALVLALVVVMSTGASAGSWKIVRVSGEAWMVSKNAPKARLASGTDLPSGVTIVTVGGARVLLKKNAETIIVGPNTKMAISPSPGSGLKTTVLQQTGTVEVDVEKRNIRHFSVETPLLAAVVKGTRFVVRVNRRGVEVSVARGRVEVTDFASGKIGNVSRGQRASSSSRGFNVTGPGRVEPIVQGRSRAPLVNAASAGAANAEQGDSANTDNNSSGNSGSGNSGSGNSGSGNGGSGNSGSGNSGSGGGDDD